MPKRTNEFQQLITLVQRSLAPKGAIVVESAMVENAGIPREIDVLVKLDAGMYKIKIAVEAKDHKRKIDIKTIEELIGKYRNPDGIQVNQVVLVARKGFSKTARARAKQVGIKLFTFDEAIRQDWDHLVPTDKPHRIAIDLAPHLALVEVVPAVSGVDPAAIQKEAHVKCLSCGQCNGSPWRMAKHVLEKHLSDDIKKQLKNAVDLVKSSNETKRFCFKINLPYKNKVLNYNGNEHPIEKLIIHIHGEHQVGALDFKCYQLTDEDGQTRTVQHGMGKVGRKNVNIMLPDGTRSSQITLDIKEDC